MRTGANANLSVLTTKGRNTRAKLISAAREVFEQDGYNDARVATITHRARTSYGSFYRYFTSKDDIFREVVKQVTGEMFALSSTGGTGGDPVTRIEVANREYLRAFANNARIMRLIDEVSPYDPYYRDLNRGIRAQFVRRIEAGIQRLQERGLADATIDAGIAASALGGMVEQFARNSFLSEEPYDEPAAVETLTILWANALRMKR